MFKVIFINLPTKDLLWFISVSYTHLVSYVQDDEKKNTAIAKIKKQKLPLFARTRVNTASRQRFNVS